jgi:hypothetical protein
MSTVRQSSLAAAARTFGYRYGYVYFFTGS